MDEGKFLVTSSYFFELYVDKYHPKYKKEILKKGFVYSGDVKITKQNEIQHSRKRI